MVRVRIEIRNTHFIVKIMDPRLNHLVKTVDGKLTSYKLMYNSRTRSMTKVKDKIWYSHTAHTNEYRYYINMLRDFILLLNQEYVKREEISIRYDKDYDVEPLYLDMKKKYKPRPNQKGYIKALLDAKTGTNKLVDARTGFGKGMVSIYSMVKLNMRTMILVLPQFIQKWEDEIIEYTKIDSEDIIRVQGGKQLETLVDDDELEAKVIIVSVRTMMLYIKDYIDQPGKFKVSPQDLLKHLKVGTLINDEAHMQTHAVFTAMLYLNPKRFIALSATLDTKQNDIKKMYDLYFPEKYKISNLVKFENYVNVYAVRYKIDNPRGILYKRAQGYNHNLFEQSIMKNSIMLKTYLDMVKFYIDDKYYKRKKKGQKALLFFASIRMCTIVANYLKDIYEDLDIKRYVEDDPFENVIESDLCVSTNQSAGTALDIPNLITVIQTVSISSLQQNQQSQGRLRRLDNTEVIYCYLYSPDIKNQVKMHYDRTEATKGLSKTYNLEEYSGMVKTK